MKKNFEAAAQDRHLGGDVTEIGNKLPNTNVVLRSSHSLYRSAGRTGDHSTQRAYYSFELDPI